MSLYAVSVRMVLDHHCYECGETWSSVTFYPFLEFVPITLFLAIILVFHISMTSAPMTCFIMYSQMIILGCYTAWSGNSHMGDILFIHTGTLRSVSKIILTLYGVLNLDYFQHYVPLFCISSRLQLIHVAFLGYISAFYPMLLIVQCCADLDMYQPSCL